MTDLQRGLIGADLSRRAFVRASVLGTGLLSWPQVMQWQARGATTAGKKQRSLILLWQDGGPSHFETFDPKPAAPSEYRGELGPIATSLPGIAYCEVLPRLARLAHLTSVIRSLHQPSSDHVVGSHNVLTGWEGETEGSKSRYPDLGAVISRMRSGAEESQVSLGASTDPRLAKGMRGGGRVKAASGDALPRYIDIGGGLHRGGPAFLGPLDGPFQVAGDPAKPNFVIQNLQSLSNPQRLLARQVMLNQLDRLSPAERPDVAAFEQMRALDGFRQQAFDLLSGGGAATAFDLTREREEVRQRYGFHLAGQQCLLARRLVEAGVGMVGIRFSPDGRGDYDRTMIGWDDHAVHGNIFAIMRQRGPQFDQAVSALIEDLETRGLRDEVLVVVVGEFGRTPKIHVHKGCPGREHWGPAGCALVYGGGFAGGQVIGSTNDKGEHPHERPLTYQSLLATIYHALGIDPAHTFINQSGRPVPILPNGEPIRELLGADEQRAEAASAVNRSKAARNEIVLPAGATNADVASLRERERIESLIIHDARIDDGGLSPLAECRSLRHLELNGTPVTNAGLAHLADVTTLESLNLTGTRVTAAGLRHLRRLVRLKSISFNATPIAMSDVIELFVQEQGRRLVDALAAMGLARRGGDGGIEAIDVAGTAFGDAELAQLGTLPTLNELHLAATQVTDAGMSHVAQLQNLEHLYLAKCEVGDAGLAHLTGLKKLQSLNLYGTKLTTAGLSHLGQLPELRHLLITDVKLEAAAVDALKAKLPRLVVTDYTAV